MLMTMLCKDSYDFWQNTEDVLLAAHTPGAGHGQTILTKRELNISLFGDTFEGGEGAEFILKFIESKDYKLYSLIIRIPMGGEDISTLCTFLDSVVVKSTSIQKIDYEDDYPSAQPVEHLKEIYQRLGVDIIEKEIDGNLFQVFPPPLNSDSWALIKDQDGTWSPISSHRLVEKIFPFFYDSFLSGDTLFQNFETLAELELLAFYVKLRQEKVLVLDIDLEEFHVERMQNLLENFKEGKEYNRQALKNLKGVDFKISLVGLAGDFSSNNVPA